MNGGLNFAQLFRYHHHFRLHCAAFLFSTIVSSSSSSSVSVPVVFFVFFLFPLPRSGTSPSVHTVYGPSPRRHSTIGRAHFPLPCCNIRLLTPCIAVHTVFCAYQFSKSHLFLVHFCLGRLSLLLFFSPYHAALLLRGPSGQHHSSGSSIPIWSYFSRICVRVSSDTVLPVYVFNLVAVLPSFFGSHVLELAGCWWAVSSPRALFVSAVNISALSVYLRRFLIPYNWGYHTYTCCLFHWAYFALRYHLLLIKHILYEDIQYMSCLHVFPIF